MDGGAEGSRTPDLLIANETLYQLSYDPNQLTHRYLRRKSRTESFAASTPLFPASGCSIGNIPSGRKQIIEHFRRFCRAEHVERLVLREVAHIVFASHKSLHIAAVAAEV